MDYFIVILSSILSGVLGVVISTIYYKKSQRRQEKIKLIVQLYGNRYNLTGDTFSEAINSIIVVFWDNSKVIEKVKSFHDILRKKENTGEQINSALIDLLKALGDDVGLKFKDFNDTFLLCVFNNKMIDKI